MSGARILWRVAAAAMAAVGIGALARLAFRQEIPAKDEPAGRDIIEEAGRESFPASDPPSWTLGAEQPAAADTWSAGSAARTGKSFIEGQ